jgi:hypothetical protein
MGPILPSAITRIEPVLLPPGEHGQDGLNESDWLLRAIVVLARKEPQTTTIKIALRRLVMKTAMEIALDF